MDIVACRTILRLVASLHARGHQRLRIVPTRSASDGTWRCTIAGARDLDASGVRLVDPEVPAAQYVSDEGRACFGWRDAADASPEALAERFVERFPVLARAGWGADWAYAGWYLELLRLTAPDDLPVAYADGLAALLGGEPPASRPRAASLCRVRPVPRPGPHARGDSPGGCVGRPCRLHGCRTTSDARRPRAGCPRPGAVGVARRAAPRAARRMVRRGGGAVADAAAGADAGCSGVGPIRGCVSGLPPVSAIRVWGLPGGGSVRLPGGMRVRVRILPARTSGALSGVVGNLRPLLAGEQGQRHVTQRGTRGGRRATREVRR